MAQRMDGKAVSAHTRQRIKEQTEFFIKETGVTPALAVILVGEDPASQVYVRNKHNGCLEVGFTSYEYRFPANIEESTLLAKIDELNADPAVHGILVQLPLPSHIREEAVIHRIDPRKDVDAFHPENVGHLMTGHAIFKPCTPAGVMELLSYYKVDPCGKHCVIVGRSNIVGKPMMHLMLEANATVTICHSRTVDLAAVTRSADILIVAIGKSRFIRADMIKPGAVVIDVGINRLPDGKLTGDVAFEEAEQVASLITPVPGGVGPMTIAMLLQNTLRAAQASVKRMKK
ncbi:MAG: bifunctional methylenetetrahydrofolate dehydrogenase/methenyltetrahydrofolate cyclohydrolase FolD [Clostridia bacterium]|nr:bifunctional methylenetetrahydrofolate dehydrogenase/methenyltetrahydrofolate cyclohydrolase FolD [Clostridia bacterium]